MNFGTYFHKETCLTSRPIDELEFIGYSLVHYDFMRRQIEAKIGSSIPLRKVDFSEFSSVHTEEYLNLIKSAASGEDVDIPTSGECHHLEFAIPGFKYSLGGLYEILDRMKEGSLNRVYCFTMPSHHAYPHKSHGYCLLNTMAAGVRYAQKIGYEKVLIVDWDTHHGDGTQTIFENDNNVHHISIHSAVDLYMSMVNATEIGTTTFGESVGQVNIPILEKRFTSDFFYNDLKLTGDFFRGDQSIHQFRKSLDSLPYKPDLIVIFDGHDSHKLDCGGGVTDWENEDFDTLTKMVIDKSIDFKCPILSMPGGGYNMNTAVELSIRHADLLKNYRG